MYRARLYPIISCLPCVDRLSAPDRLHRCRFSQRGVLAELFAQTDGIFVVILDVGVGTPDPMRHAVTFDSGRRWEMYKAKRMAVSGRADVQFDRMGVLQRGQGRSPFSPHAVAACGRVLLCSPPGIADPICLPLYRNMYLTDLFCGGRARGVRRWMNATVLKARNAVRM